MMGPTPLFGLPPEILEHILLFLPPADILRMKEVNHLFLDVVSGSQDLQHPIDLFNAGLVEDSRAPHSLAERRVRLRKHVDGWNNPDTSVQYGYPLKYQANAIGSRPVGNDLFVAHADYRVPVLLFARIPSSSHQGTLEEWALELPFPVRHCLVWSQDNLLAIIGHQAGAVGIHLLNILDGLPHEIPAQKVLSLSFSVFSEVVAQQISNRMIALMVRFQNYFEEGSSMLIVWDWRVGEVVLEYSNGDPDIGDAISNISTIHFLEDSWLLTLSRRSSSSQLLVFNTLLPRNWKILALPRHSDNTNYMIPIQYEYLPTEFPELSIDPAQKKFIVSSKRGSTLVIPMESLVRAVHSARASDSIPWGDWGEDVIRVHHRDTMMAQLVGTKVLTLCGLHLFPGNWVVRMCDLNKSGQKDAQVRRVGKEYERVLSTPKWSAHCKMPKDNLPDKKFFVGNKVVCFYTRESPSGEDYFVRIWKIG